jgi:hypothetical protein
VPFVTVAAQQMNMLKPAELRRLTMSLLHNTDVYQGTHEKADLAGYGFVLAYLRGTCSRGCQRNLPRYF